MLYSIGYQNKNIDDIISILKAFKINYLLDVRSKPYSRKPQFNQPALKKSIEDAGISYIWAGRTLGGMKDIKDKDIKQLAQ